MLTGRQRPRLGDPPFLPTRLSSAASPGGAGVPRMLRLPPRGPCHRRMVTSPGKQHGHLHQSTRAVLGAGRPRSPGHGCPCAPALAGLSSRPASSVKRRAPWGPVDRGQALGLLRVFVPTARARRGASPLTPPSLGPTCSNEGDAGDPQRRVGAKSDEWGVQPWLAGGRDAVSGVLHHACWGTGMGAGGVDAFGLETKARQGWECLSW